jgi:hypothetical protein
VVEGERADGGIVSLEDCLKIECQPVPCCELPTRGTGQYAATLWRPLGEKSGRGNRKHLNGMTNRDRIYGTSDFVRGGVDEFGTERRRRVVRVGFWR